MRRAIPVLFLFAVVRHVYGDISYIVRSMRIDQTGTDEPCVWQGLAVECQSPPSTDIAVCATEERCDALAPELCSLSPAEQQHIKVCSSARLASPRLVPHERAGRS